MIAFVRAVTLRARRRDRCRSGERARHHARAGERRRDRVRLEGRLGTITSSPGSNAAAAIIAISSSAPLPTRSWAGARPWRFARAPGAPWTHRRIEVHAAGLAHDRRDGAR